MAGLCHEELDAEHLTAVFETQDLIHPLADPLQRFGSRDGPDEQDLLGGAGSERVLGKQLMGIADAVGDADTAGEHDHCAVRFKRLVAAVWAFDRAPGGEDLARQGIGALVQFSRHTVPHPHDEGDGRDVFFVGAGCVGMFGPVVVSANGTVLVHRLARHSIGPPGDTKDVFWLVVGNLLPFQLAL